MVNQNIAIHRIDSNLYPVNSIIKNALGYAANSATTQLNPNRYYILGDGSLQIEYISRNTKETITSPYGDGVNNYIDNWAYNEDLLLRIDPTTIFYSINIESSKSHDVKFIKIPQNDIISINANQNSVLYVTANNFLYNGNFANTANDGVFKTHRIEFDTAQTISIGSLNTKLYCLLVE